MDGHDVFEKAKTCAGLGGRCEGCGSIALWWAEENLSNAEWTALQDGGWCDEICEGDCHQFEGPPWDDGYDEPLGLIYSRLDPVGVYAEDGTKLGSTCGCEDYPCCGH